MHFLTAGKVELLAAAITVPFPMLVRSDAYTGLRAGELAALNVGRLDLLRGTCEVLESATEAERYFKPPARGRWPTGRPASA